MHTGRWVPHAQVLVATERLTFVMRSRSCPVCVCGPCGLSRVQSHPGPARGTAGALTDTLIHCLDPRVDALSSLEPRRELRALPGRVSPTHHTQYSAGGRRSERAPGARRGADSSRIPSRAGQQLKALARHRADWALVQPAVCAHALQLPVARPAFAWSGARGRWTKLLARGRAEGCAPRRLGEQRTFRLADRACRPHRPTRRRRCRPWRGSTRPALALPMGWRRRAASFS